MYRHATVHGSNLGHDGAQEIGLGAIRTRRDTGHDSLAIVALEWLWRSIGIVCPGRRLLGHVTRFYRVQPITTVRSS
jgi:hypothetical protein